MCVLRLYKVTITKISNSMILSFGDSVAVDTNRIKVKMCMTVSFSSWVFLDLLVFGVFCGLLFFFHVLYLSIAGRLYCTGIMECRVDSPDVTAGLGYDLANAGCHAVCS